MSLIGVKSLAKAGIAAAMVDSLHSFPDSAASTAAARLGVPAMPPNAIRALSIFELFIVKLKQPQTADMS